jgi:hypothetical protein
MENVAFMYKSVFPVPLSTPLLPWRRSTIGRAFSDGWLEAA